MNGICKDCIFFRCGFCFSEGDPEKITGEITKCDNYFFSAFKETYNDGFIQGFCHCNNMRKKPQIQKIETRAKQEVFIKIIEIINHNKIPEFVVIDLCDYLKSEGYKV